MQSKASSFRARTFFITGAVFLGIVLLAFVMSLICSPYDPNATSAREILLPPSGAHLFGTDNFGRDVFSRILDASKYTIFISIAGVAIALFLGVLSGLPAGYFGGFPDRVIMLFNNSIMCFPGILLALVAVAVFGPSMFNVVWALGLVFAPTFARVCRAGAMDERLHNACEGHARKACQDNVFAHTAEPDAAASSRDGHRSGKHDAV